MQTKFINSAVQSTLLQSTISDKVDCKETTDNIKTVHTPEESVVCLSQNNSQKYDVECRILKWLGKYKQNYIPESPDNI